MIDWIYAHLLAVKKRVPDAIGNQMLLTGGGAACLFGSDRPFSNNLDFLIPESFQPVLEDALGVRFATRDQKPVFHSLAVEIPVEGVGDDLILRSIVQPEGVSHSFAFSLNQDIIERQVKIPYRDDFIACVPRELLVLIKLLAGRDETMGKYDLYDARLMIQKAPAFDWDFFKRLVHDFCQPLTISIPVLRGHAKGLLVEPLEIVLRSFE